MAIIKVQAAISPPGAPSLIYDENKRRMTHQVLDSSVTAQLGDDLKGYFHGAFNEDKWMWTIGKRVADQPW